MEPLLLTADVQIQAGESGKRSPTIAIVAYTGNTLKVNGWPELIVDLAGADVSGEIPILASHESDNLDAIAGSGTAEIRNNQILVSGRLTDATPAGQKVIALGRSGISIQASIGYSPEKREYISGGHKLRVNGREFTAGESGLTIIRQGRLREVSLLPVGADVGSQVSIKAKGNIQMDFNDWLTSKGFDPSTINDVQRTSLQAAYRADTRQGADTEIIQARWTDARWHYTDGTEGPYHRAHAAFVQASRGDITASQFESVLQRELLNDRELKIMRDERPRHPAIHASRRDVDGQVIEAALARSIGLPSREKAYTPQVIEASDKLGSFGLQELLLTAATANGYSTGRHRVDASNLRDVLRAAFSPSIQAGGFSTVDVSGILGNVASKALNDGFLSVEQTWREISRRRPAKDFKTMTVYRLTDSLEYELLPASAEIPHGTLGEESFTIKADTYARMLTLTRTDIINDDLGAFDDLRNRLGRGAGLKLNKIFWTAFLDNASFFSEDNSNLVTDVLTDDPDSLSAAIAAFASLADNDGNPLGIMPSLLLTGPTLSPVAKRLFTSTEIRNTTDSTTYTVGNVVQGMYKPLMSAYLELSSLSGYSATQWFLLADPKVLPVMEVAFLDGKESPTVEAAEADFSTLGISVRGYHDVGVSKAEFRGGVRSTGAGA